jgi:hypothetical protein
MPGSFAESEIVKSHPLFRTLTRVFVVGSEKLEAPSSAGSHQTRRLLIIDVYPSDKFF